MKKLRPWPIVLSSIITVVVLFGGWYGYRSLTIETPLSDLVHQLPEVDNAELTVKDSNIEIDMKVKPEANIRELVKQVYADTKEIAGNRTIKLHIADRSNEALDTWWANALFDVAEAMELKQYGKIPQVLQERAQLLPGIGIQTEMDEQNVYVKLTQGEAYKVIVLPRVPNQLGVWPNA